MYGNIGLFLLYFCKSTQNSDTVPAPENVGVEGAIMDTNCRFINIVLNDNIVEQMF
jgi:hypothetical protein